MEISVCMIVKDEQQTLPKILDCIKRFADEIVIVDTGSKDNTIKIAKKYTDKVFCFKWENDFSSARNFSFSKASKDFVMWLDADDFITDENIDKILKLKENEKDKEKDFYFLKYAIAFDSAGKPTFEYFRERIMRRKLNPTWQGFIHEAVTASGNISYENITVEHHRQKRHDAKRNLKMYLFHHKTKTFNAREQYYFAKEYYYNGYYKSCIKNLKKFLKMENRFLPNVYDANLTIARSYFFLKKYQHAIDFLLDFLKTNTPNSEICCELGRNFEAQGKTELSKMFYQNALLCQPNYQGFFVEKDFYHFIPLFKLCGLYYKTDYEISKNFFMLAKQQNPNHINIIQNQKFFE